MTSLSASDITKKDQKYWLLGDTYTFHVTGVETNGKYAVVEISSPPGGGPPLHSHTKEIEGFYVIDGEFSFQHGDNKTVSKPGTFLHLEERIFHTYKNVGNSVGQLLLTIIPAGFENFFAELGIHVKDEENFFPPSMNTVDIPKIVRIANEKYGLNIMVPNQEKGQ